MNMDESTRQFVLGILEQAKDLALATVRPDGYPQATTVCYANDGLTLYVGVGKGSQKAENIRRNNKVSLTISAPYQDWNQIKGLSMGGVAEIVSDGDELRRATQCMLQRFPQLSGWTEPGLASEVVFLRITPQVISVLDYARGFGHADLVTV